jgi:hypothetical protein
MPVLDLKATHKPVQHFYSALRQCDDLGVGRDGAVRSAFHGLLDHCARQHGWTFVPEQEVCGNFDLCYSRDNILFQAARRKILAAEIPTVDVLASQTFSRAASASPSSPFASLRGQMACIS